MGEYAPNLNFQFLSNNTIELTPSDIDTKTCFLTLNLTDLFHSENSRHGDKGIPKVNTS